MRQKLSVYKNREFPGYYFFLLGVIIGVILPNLMYKMQWRQDTASALYLMGICAEEGSQEYFWKVIRMRGVLFLLVSGSGFTIFGVPIAVGSVVLFGMVMAMLLTMSVIQFGLHGGLAGAGMLFPQFMIYVPCLLVTCGIIYENSMQIWKNRNFLPAQISSYILKMLICSLFLGFGILLEAYCNPIITEILIRNLKIF